MISSTQGIWSKTEYVTTFKLIDTLFFYRVDDEVVYIYIGWSIKICITIFTIIISILLQNHISNIFSIFVSYSYCNIGNFLKITRCFGTIVSII